MRIGLYFDIYKNKYTTKNARQQHIDDKRIEAFAEYVTPVLDEKIVFSKTQINGSIKFNAEVYVFTEAEMFEIIHLLDNKSEALNNRVKNLLLQ